MQANAVSVPAQQGSEDDDEELCVVCWEQAREIIFMNCGHMVCA